jgi:hypothetical protein
MPPRNETTVFQLQTHEARFHRAGQPEQPGVVIEINSLARARELREERPLKCVASRHLAGGCSCRATLPAGVAAAAWDRAQGLGEGLDGFFRFAWRGEAWLGFGVAGREVRGVFCPTHLAEREALTAQSA